MTFEVEVNGRSRSVAVEAAGPGRFRVTIDGQVHLVDAARIGEFGLSLMIDGNQPASREAQVVPCAGPGETLVWIDGRTMAAAVDGRRRRRKGDEGGSGAEGVQSVVAPMPGLIVRVNAEVGDQVHAGQGLVVMEAMKMENELRAQAAGRVKAVLVAPGAVVEKGQ